jgi:toxin CcdB
MSQFDVYTKRSGDGLVLDCQTDLLSHLSTRLVAPLMVPDRAPKAAGRLNPSFAIDGVVYVLVTQFSGAVEVAELGHKRGSLASNHHQIINALDFLITGV